MVRSQINGQSDPRAWIVRLDTPVQGAANGPLAGLTFAVKDNIDVAEIRTTAACADFPRLPATSAVAVQKLLDAGASLMGKTNLDQFACGLNGTRSDFGPVPNAIDPLYVSGGSSSGSAQAVAMGEVDFALGTDTAGSGRVPAGLNNIVGIKPSKGLISTRGVLPAAQSVDCVSIFARTVAVASRVLSVLAGPDELDPYSRRLEVPSATLKRQFRFGVPQPLEFFGDHLARAEFDRAVEKMISLGGTPVTFDFKPFAQAASLLYESALVAERYAAIREYFDANEASVIEPVRSIIGAGKNYDAADVFDAQTQLASLAQQAAHIWNDIDLMLVPTAPTHYTIEQMLASPVELNRNLGAYTNFVNLLDYAAVSVPSSMRSDGLPFGVTFIGPCASDWTLAEFAQKYHLSTSLTQGATGEPLGLAEVLPPVVSAEIQTLQIAAVGAHLSGMALNWQLTELGATLRSVTSTSASYRLFALPGTVPPKPGMVRVKSDGAPIALEVWDVPASKVGRFLSLIAAPLGLGNIELANGRWVHGFLCEGHALEGAPDITSFGGWRNYVTRSS